MALNSLFSADVPLSNYSLTRSIICFVQFVMQWTNTNCCHSSLFIVTCSEREI